MQKRKWSDDEIAEFRREYASPIYFNRADSRLLVPKSSGVGRTFNFANPITWGITVLIVTFIIIYKLYYR